MTKRFEFRIEPLSPETTDATIERFNALGAEGWHAVGKYSLNHMLFERETETKSDRPAVSANTCDIAVLMNAMASDNLIEAIKTYRSMTGQGLVESKDAVERVMRRGRYAT